MLLIIHLAELYEVEPRVLIQAVNRNIKRFPEDFMFQLIWDEVAVLKSHPKFYGVKPEPSLRSQIVILKKGNNIKHLPYAFYRTGRRHALRHPAQRPGNPGEY